MKTTNNVIDLSRYQEPRTECPGCRSTECPTAKLSRLHQGVDLVIAAFEALTTAAIGVCCIACLVLVYTML